MDAKKRLVSFLSHAEPWPDDEVLPVKKIHGNLSIEHDGTTTNSEVGLVRRGEESTVVVQVGAEVLRFRYHSIEDVAEDGWMVD